MGEEDEVGNALNDDEERLSLNKTTRMNGDDIEDEQQQNEQLNDEILNEPPLKKRRNDETAKIVKERGCDSSTNTWEHESELTQCRKLVEKYWNERKQKE